MPARAESPEPFEKTAAEVRNFAVNCTAALDSGESLTGTPTGVSDPTGLTIANLAVSVGTLTILGASVAAGAAITGTVSGGTADTAYTLKLTVDTDASNAQTIEVWLSTIKVIAS